jgi:hypothetical protein
MERASRETWMKQGRAMDGERPDGGEVCGGGRGQPVLAVVAEVALGVEASDTDEACATRFARMRQAADVRRGDGAGTARERSVALEIVLSSGVRVLVSATSGSGARCAPATPPMVTLCATPRAAASKKMGTSSLYGPSITRTPRGSLVAQLSNVETPASREFAERRREHRACGHRDEARRLI